MYYVQRDETGRLVRADSVPFPGMTEEVSDETREISVWLKAAENAQQLAMLEKSDLGMVRVLDDLIYLLMRKGVISITDLPTMAQQKLASRAQARQELGGLEDLLKDDNGIF